MKKSKLKLEPQQVDKHTWYYEQEKGICIVREVLDKRGDLIQTEQFHIKWNMLLDSLERKYG